MERDSICLISKKVAAATGDCRRALYIGQKATERDKKKVVEMNEVLHEMFASPIIVALKLVRGREKSEEESQEEEDNFLIFTLEIYQESRNYFCT